MMPMENYILPLYPTKSPTPRRVPECLITLADGSELDLAELDLAELAELQYEQEVAFAEQIRRSRKGSAERREAVQQAYDTVCTILAQMSPTSANLVMGLDQRYVQLVLRLLQSARRRHADVPRMFEIGYGCGALLAEVAAAGYEVAGIEVSAAMRAQALPIMPPDAHEQLLLGDFLQQDMRPLAGRFDLVYWNDVFEHVPPDEIRDYLAQISSLLRPGGTLVTITPNWHERPSDVTSDFCPPRTPARGLHLKEYSLGEVTSLLREAGFARVETPLVVLPHNIYLGLGGLAPLKRFCEPALEYLPFRLARLMVHGFGYAYTIAHKPAR